MIHEAKAQGATIEEALQNARAALNAPADADVHVELISQPVKGLLGLFGKKKAEARAFYETPDAPVKKQPEKKPQQKQPQKPQQQKPQQQKPQKQEKKPQPKPVKAEAQPAAPAKEADGMPKAEINPDDKPGVKAGADYLLAMVQLMGVREATVKAYVHADNEVLLELDCGEDYGIVIGRRGETLDSIQYLTRLVANKKKTEGEYSRISINVGNYREKRHSTLASLAKKNAEKVLKYGRNFTFEPMNPYERRIIHTTIQEIEGVTSHSVGNDDERRVVITLAEGVKPTHPNAGRPSGNRGGRGHGGRSGGRGGRSGGSSQTVAAPTRAPKTDAGAEGVSLYGKLN